MNIGIVGSSGYLGTNLLTYLTRKGHKIEKISHHLLIENKRAMRNLNLILDCGFPRNIHISSISENYLFNLNNRVLIAKQIGIKYAYIGSLSEDSGGVSTYGKNKLVASNIVKDHDGLIIKTGLVVDFIKPGGRYEELLILSHRLPILFLPHRSFFPVGVTELNDFINTVDRLVSEQSFSNSEILCRIRWTTLTDLIQAASNSYHIHLSYSLTKLLCKILRIIPLGKYDNIKSISTEIVAEKYH
jgi:hypothetical protein